MTFPKNIGFYNLEPDIQTVGVDFVSFFCSPCHPTVLISQQLQLQQLVAYQEFCVFFRVLLFQMHCDGDRPRRNAGAIFDAD
jgi:hypothetical protein